MMDEPVAVIVGRANFLAINLVELLLAKRCQVFIFSGATEKWVKETVHLKENLKLKIYSIEKPWPTKADYLFWLTGFGGQLSTKKVARRIEEFCRQTFSKFYLILPFVGEIKKPVLKSDITLTTVWVGELFGPRMDFEKRGVVADVLASAILSNQVIAPAPATKIYPAFVGDVARELVKSIFSFGFGQEEVVLARPSTVGQLTFDLARINPRLSFTYHEAKKQPTAKISNFLSPKESVPNSLKTTLTWFADRKALVPKTQPTEAKKTKKVKKVVKKPLAWKRLLIELKFSLPKIRLVANKKVVVALSLVVFFLSFPFSTLIGSGFFLKGAYEAFLAGKYQKVQTFLNVSDGLARITQSYPLVLPWARQVSSILVDTNRAARKTLVLSQKALRIVNNVFGDTQTSLVEDSVSLATELDALYRETSFLETELANLNFASSGLSQGLEKLKQWRPLLLSAATIAKRLPLLLGEEGVKTYLVLFQNNMELRPTGGFIGSFGLVTFDKGKLIDVEVFDVYSADGQLKGHVEPPAPIKTYLGEANWFLRDANWDPDFPTSAARIEWFLDKEIDRAVDGVIGVDLEMVKQILAATGPVSLTDFGVEINEKNIYERVQYEAEENFFPGSRKKANFLTALSQTMLDRLIHSEEEKYVRLARVFLENLKARHVQLFFHDQETARALGKAGWSGAVEIAECSGNCGVSWLAMSEANVGVNKVNYFVDRQMSLSVKVADQKVINTLVIEYQNDAPSALGIGARYKNYLRLLLPLEAQVQEVLVGTEKVDPETEKINGRLEAGTLVEIPSNAKTRVTFVWESPVNLDFANPGYYQISWQKQAGTVADPVTVALILPPGVEASGPASYNTNLLTDFNHMVSW